MRIGYPCINRSLGCTAGRTFRLASYSRRRMAETVALNLDCLEKILAFNAVNGLLFFRISSDLIPFASHPVCRFPWAERFGERLRAIGRLIKKQGFRISMHPDQFTLINSPDGGVFNRSAAELEYHCRVLDLMGLDRTARVQIHVGGVYGDRETSMKRFVERFRSLDRAVRRRLTIENDERLYPVADCLALSRATGVPVLFDLFHHRLNHRRESAADALDACAATWPAAAGIPMVDYSSQQPGGRPGKHAESIDTSHFKRFLRATRGIDFDVMLEIKDKEKSALAALAAAGRDRRLAMGV